MENNFKIHAKIFLFFTIFLFAPLFVILAEADKKVLVVSKAVSDAIIPGLWQGVKLMTPFIILAILLKIGFVFLEKRIDKWKKK